MTKFFDGLFPYEIVLLVLGALLFVVLVFLLVYTVLKNRQIKSVVQLFLVTLAMMGFPGIQMVKFSNGVLEIQRLTRKVEQDPSDQTARAELSRKLAELEPRPIASEDTRLAVAGAQAALGEQEKARVNVDLVLRRRPDLTAALRLKERLSQPGPVETRPPDAPSPPRGRVLLEEGHRLRDGLHP